MSEQCTLRLIQAAANQMTIWEGDIPPQCRKCIRFQIEKRFVQLNLEYFGLANVTVDSDTEKPYRVGGRASDVHGREIIFEKLSPAIDERKRHYEPFHCDRPSLMPAGRTSNEEVIKPDSKYL